MSRSGDDESISAAGIFFGKLPKEVTLVIVIFVVSAPEGLPLTIGVSLAFSVMKMFKDKILVRQLDAPEKLGGVDEICCGKTGTLTKNEMKVAKFYTEEKRIKNTRKDTLTNCELSRDTLTRI